MHTADVQTLPEWNDLSPHFSQSELLSPDTLAAWHLWDLDSVRAVNAFREAVGVPLLCNHGPHKLRGLRSAAEQVNLQKWNKNAADLSLHVTGKAFDLSSPQRTIDELVTMAIAFGWGGIGIYPTFVHVDRRPLVTGKPLIFHRS